VCTTGSGRAILKQGIHCIVSEGQIPTLSMPAHVSASN